MSLLIFYRGDKCMRGLYPVRDPDQLEQEHDILSRPKGLSFLPEYKIEAIVTKNGKVISKKSWKAKTWVYNFLRLLFGLFYALMISDTVTTVTDTAGISRDVPGIASGTSSAGCVRAPEGNANYGIAVGSGASPSYDPSKYALDSKIAESAMSPSECTAEFTAENQIRITRTFVNNSGGELTVTEVALICDWNGFPIMIAYDVPSGGISVPAGASLTLRYIISLS